MGCLKGEYPKSGVRIGVYVLFCCVILWIDEFKCDIFQGMFLLHLNIDLESAAFFGGVGFRNMLRVIIKKQMFH